MGTSKAKWSNASEDKAKKILASHALSLREMAEHIAAHSESQYVSPNHVVTASAALKLSPAGERLADILSNTGFALFGLGGGAVLQTLSSETPVYNGWFIAAAVMTVLGLPTATTGLALKSARRI
jgi:hypothetical protein